MTDTITVQGYFGDKQINREDFTQTWADHAHELRKLSYTQEWQNRVDQIYLDVVETAGAEFDRILKEQNEK